MKLSYTRSICILVATWLCFQPLCSMAAVSVGITPSIISNTYSAPITLQIKGLTAGDTVVVQKFIDANTNGVLDSRDPLWQQFSLTDGQATVIGGVTNFNVPGDTDNVSGQITAQLYLQNDFSQTLVGKYLFVVSSPAGHFTPLTNSFSITNFGFAQKFTGKVMNNGTNVPYASVLLFQPSSGGGGGGGGMNPQGGAVADLSGDYTIKAPPGTYALVPLSFNFVSSVGSAPNFTLSSGQTLVTNLSNSFITATQSISGKLVDANNSSLGIPGVLMALESSNSFLAVSSTDTNGNFNVPVVADQWKVQPSEQSLDTHGYLASQNKLNVSTASGSVSGLSIALPKATALFYGTVKDNSGNPLTHVQLYSSDQVTGNYQDNGVYTDPNGNYVALALAGTWRIGVSSDSNPAFANYIFSQGTQTNVSAGQAIQNNFTAIVATNQITGNVQFNGNPVSSVQEFAYATINGTFYQAQADTDSSGNYALNVPNGAWSVNVNCQGGNNSLDSILGSGNYQCPSTQSVNITNNNGVANFIVQPCNGVQISTTSLQNGQVNTYYSVFLNGSSCSGNLTWSVNDPQNFPPGLTLGSNGQIFGTPSTAGTYNFSVNANDNNGHSANQGLSLMIIGTPLQVTSSFLLNATNGISYNQTLQASGGTPPYNWSIPSFSAPLPPNLTLGSNGVLSGTPTTNGTFYFDVIVTDTVNNSVEKDGLVLNVVNPPPAALVITNNSLPNGNVGALYNAQLAVTGGQPPYYWSLAIGSANPPPGLVINPNGFISGTPTSSGLFSFKVQATDVNSSSTNKVFAVLINPRPILLFSGWQANHLQMQLIGGSNQNYTIQATTNVSVPNWVLLVVTNSPTASSFIVTDPNPTNSQRFYRALIGP